MLQTSFQRFARLIEERSHHLGKGTHRGGGAIALHTGEVTQSLMVAQRHQRQTKIARLPHPLGEAGRKQGLEHRLSLSKSPFLQMYKPCSEAQ